jgi:chromosome segregation ATPase
MQKQLDKVDAWREKVKAAKIEDNATIASLTEDLQATQAQLGELATAREAADADGRQLRAHIEELETHVAQLKQDSTEAQQQLEGLREQLKAAETARDEAARPPGPAVGRVGERGNRGVLRRRGSVPTRVRGW